MSQWSHDSDLDYYEELAGIPRRSYQGPIRMPVQCQICGKRFTAFDSATFNHPRCSEACETEAHRRRKAKP